MTQEVGHLRDEKMKLEQAIAELFAIKAKHGEHVSLHCTFQTYSLRLDMQAHQVQQQPAQQQHQQHARRSTQVYPAPPQQYGHPQPGAPPQLAPPATYSQQLPQGFHQGNMAPARLQMPHPLAGQSQNAGRAHMQGRPLPVAGSRSAPSSASRPGRPAPIPGRT